MLDGKHALVTGGGTGIGLAIARALAQAGAQVTITGRRAEVLRAAAAETPGLHPEVMDVANESSVRNGIARAAEARGPVAICVGNAGIAEGRSIAKTDFDFWRDMMAINLDGCFMTIRESLATLGRDDWARVIAVSSIAGLKGLKGAPAYSASKHGVIGLIRALAQDYAQSDKTFNALCPAYVDTDIITRNTASIQARTGLPEDEARALMTDLNPHGRLITPDEVADTALWLCGPNSGSVNGTAIEIAGGVI